MNGEEQRTHKKALNKLSEDVVTGFEHLTTAFDERILEEVETRTEAIGHLQAQIRINHELLAAITVEARSVLRQPFLGRLRWLIAGK